MPPSTRVAPSLVAAATVEIRYADTGAGRVAYVVVGERPVETVVLNPGVFSVDGIQDQPRLRDGLDRLARRGGVACLDRRGIGLSDPMAGSDPTRPPLIDQWVADVVAVIDALAVTPIVFAGSDTGLVAVAVGSAHPDRVRGLVLVHAYPRYTRGDGYPFGVDPHTAASMSADVLDVDATAPGFNPVAHIAPSAADDADFRRWFDTAGRRAASPGVAAALHRAVLEADVRDRLPHVTVPVLLLHRRNCASSDIGHARYLSDQLPDADLVLLPGADELWFVGDTAALLDEVERWLDQRRLVPSAAS